MKTRTNNPSILGALLLALSLIAPVRLAAQNFTNLFNFPGAPGQTGPFGALISSGNTFYGITHFGGVNGNGTVFAYNLATGFTNLYTFSAGNTNAAGLFTNLDGVGPTASLVLSGNTLYGTTDAGGTNGYGTVFAITTNGLNFNAIYTFTNGLDGANPEASLIVSGNVLYGTANSGGANSNGTVFALNTDGTGFTNVYTFTLGATNAAGLLTNLDGAFPFTGVTLVGGTLYGTTLDGGRNGSGTLFSVGTNGANFKAAHTFASAPAPNYFNADGAIPEGNLLLAGNILYGTTFRGGPTGNGTLFTFNTASQTFASIHNFPLGNNNLLGQFTNYDGAGPAAGLALVGNTLYGTTADGGIADNGTLFAINTNGGGLTVLHSFTSTGATGTNNDGAQSAAQVIIYNNSVYGTTAYGGTNGAGALFAASEISEPFTISSTNGNVPLTITFSASATDNFNDPITKWFWTFGDGSTSSVENPSHNYVLAGAYPTSLVATNNHGLVMIEPGPTLQLTAVSTTVAFTATPTSGLLPLPVSFTSPAVDSTGVAITHWNWNFGDGGVSTLQNPSHTYSTPGNYVPSLVATNTFGGVVSGYGPSSITATNLLSSLGLVLNGGFESGDFTGWTLSGSPANNVNIFVDNGSGSEILPHTGTYLAAFGATGSLSYLSQTLATTPGAAYNLSFWLNSPDGLAPNEFLASWNGNTLVDQVNLPALGWTNLQFLVTATQTNTVLEFGFRDDPSYLGLDDVSVFPSSFSIAGITLSGTDIALSGQNGVSGGTYFVLSTTNIALPLNQWTPIATNTLSAAGNFTITVTNAVSTNVSQQFYILQLQ